MNYKEEGIATTTTIINITDGGVLEGRNQEMESSSSMDIVAVIVNQIVGEVEEKERLESANDILIISEGHGGGGAGFILPSCGANQLQQLNGHDDTLSLSSSSSLPNHHQVQIPNEGSHSQLTTSSTATLPPVNLGDSCEVEVSKENQNKNQGILEAGLSFCDAPTDSDLSKEEVILKATNMKLTAPELQTQVQNGAAANMNNDKGEEKRDQPPSPRISIAVTGINLNLLRRPGSPGPGSPFSPSSVSQSSPLPPMTPTSTTADAYVVENKQTENVLQQESEPKLETPLPPSLIVGNDADTQVSFILTEIEDKKEPVAGAGLVNPCDSSDFKTSQTQSLSDTENNNDGNLCESELNVVCAQPSTSSSSSCPILCPPHSPVKDAKPIRSSLKRRSENHMEPDGSCPPIKKRRGITFDGVTVFYFPRTQGFSCVPSQGGSTLGMSSQHVFSKTFTLQEYAAEQRRAHKQILLKMRKQQKEQMTGGRPSQLAHEDEMNGSTNGNQSSDDDDESDEGEVETDSELEAELDGYYFLQPVPTRQRRVMLREAGVKKIDSVEKDECKDIRSSREFCGCSCRTYCDPDTCSCAQADIKCQVDRLNFPCGCTRDGCGNQNGRVEFNPVRVRTHYIQTLMRLELEKRQNTHQGNCGLDVDPPGFHRTSLSMQSIGHHANNSNHLGMNTSTGHGMGIPYGSQQNHCPIQSWDNTGMGTSSGTMAYGYKRDDMASTNTNYGNNIVRDVVFNSGIELECASIGNYTNFHYNTRLPQQPIDLDNFNLHDPHPPNNHSVPAPMQFPIANEILPSREDSFDLYSTFTREDSYSENSDEFSNESGDQRQFASPCVAVFNNQSVVATQPQVMPNQTRYNNGFYEGQIALQHSGSSYHDNLMVVENHHHLTSMSMSNSNGVQRAYNMNSNGSAMFTADSHNQYQVGNGTYAPNYRVPNMASNTDGNVYGEKLLENHHVTFAPVVTSSSNSVGYSELGHTDTEEYSKVMLCTASDAHNSAGALRNGFQPVQHDELEEGKGEVIPGDRTTENADNVEIQNENFGEIIKKSMVETVSA